VGALLHVRLRGVLAQGPQALAHLAQLDLAIAAVVEQVESLLEFCGKMWLFVRELSYKINVTPFTPTRQLIYLNVLEKSTVIYPFRGFVHTWIVIMTLIHYITLNSKK